MKITVELEDQNEGGMGWAYDSRTVEIDIDEKIGILLTVKGDDGRRLGEVWLVINEGNAELWASQPPDLDQDPFVLMKLVDEECFQCRLDDEECGSECFIARLMEERVTINRRVG